MPDMYEPHEYDLAGFSTGIAEKEDLLSSSLAKAGDHLIALPSSGVHSNGFSLIRKILFKDHDVSLDDKPAELSGKTVGETLLTPTRIYIKAVLPLVKKHLIHGIAHITGGGFIENLPRIYDDNLQAVINKGSWPGLPIFDYLKKIGVLSDQDCYNTFNMGIGLVLAVSSENVDAVKEQLNTENEEFYEIGKLTARPAGKAKIVIEQRIKMRVAILASGNGTNFEALTKQFQVGEIPGNEALMFCNHPNAQVIKRAERLGVPHETFSVKECGGKDTYEERLLKVLQDYQIDFIVLSGYLRMVGPKILNEYPNSIINLHPALLPNYPGLNSIERAFDDYKKGKIKETGVTVHFIDVHLDHGPIIAQQVVPIYPDDTVDTLEARVHETEHKLFPATLKKVLSQRMEKEEKQK